MRKKQNKQQKENQLKSISDKLDRALVPSWADKKSREYEDWLMDGNLHPKPDSFEELERQKIIRKNFKREIAKKKRLAPLLRKYRKLRGSEMGGGTH
jgi:hypothetical protein